MNYLANFSVPLLLAAIATPAQADAWWLESQVAPPPQRFLIERVMPGASKSSAAELRAGVAKSNAVLRELGPDIQWVHSYVAGDKLYCVYQAPSESLIREHARRSGFPADKITPITAVLDPTTASR
jgi:uncharacterized protein DUF4242